MSNALFDGETVHDSRIIYTPSPFARANLLHLQEVGRLQARQPHESRRQNLPSYLCFLVCKGSGELEYDGALHSLHEGDVVFLDYRRSYVHRTGSDLWQLQWVHFYGPNLSAIHKKYQERGGRPCCQAKQPQAYARVLDKLYQTADSDSYLRDMYINEHLSALLTLLMEESWQPGAIPRRGAKKQNLQQIKEYLDMNYSQKITLDDLAERFYLNKFYLTRVFKEQFGVSVNGYLTQIRITHAKRQLRFTDASIEKIGQECGLCDANYFSRVFRKVEGVSPGEYRRRW